MRNLLILYGVLTATFLCVGFAEGGLGYLSEKMDNPFVRQLTFRSNTAYLMSTGSSVTSIEELKDSLSTNDREIRYQYSGSDILPFHVIRRRFYKANDEVGRMLLGRSIGGDNPIIEALLGAENLIKIAGDGKPHEVRGRLSGGIGIIVTEDFLRVQEYDELPSFVFFEYRGAGSFRTPMQIPVLAIVKKLPDKAAFALSEPLMFMIKGQVAGCELSLEQNLEYKTTLHIGFPASSIKGFGPDGVVDAFRSAINSKYGAYDLNWAYAFPSFDLPGAEKPKVLEIFLSDVAASVEDALDAWDLVSDSAFAEVMEQYGGAHFFAYDCNQNLNKFDKAEFLSVFMANLDSVGAFERELAETFSVSVDMDAIEAKNNLNLFSGLARILAVFLIVFSVFSVTSFLTNLMSSHFERIKQNLGTFKAFGLSTNSLITSYSMISLKFVGMALIASFVTSFVIGSTGILGYLLVLVGVDLETTISTFDFFTPMGALTILSILVIPYLFVLRTLKRLLKATPGDLIYHRD